MIASFSRPRGLVLSIFCVLLAGLGCSSSKSTPADSVTGGAGGAASDARPIAEAGTPAAGTDSFDTEVGAVRITPIQHASVLVQWNNLVIYVDPSEGVFTGLPKADLILISHEHSDHLNMANITALRKDTTIVIANAAVAAMLPGAQTIGNGDVWTMGMLQLEAVPAYNTTAERLAFHPRGRDNGYILKFGTKQFYFSGDTECPPEIMGLRQIDVAFLCVNLPFTMTEQQAADCVKSFVPRVVYPYHYRNQNQSTPFADLALFQSMVGGTSEVRRRAWYP
jgi:L-ascorbate metabolism protein UlaG (beta-lactamase superfamily)